MNDNPVSSAATSTVAPLQSSAPPPQRILVVDDDDDIRQFNARALVSSGFNVEVAADGDIAWKTLQLNRYHLVITDHRMPKVTGVELLEKLHAARLAVPVIMATGTPPEAEFARCPWLQPKATLIKPYTADELLVKVREVLGVTVCGNGPAA